MMNTTKPTTTASAPETRKNDPNKNWAMYNPDKANPKMTHDEAMRTPGTPEHADGQRRLMETIFPERTIPAETDESDGEGQYECAECASTYHPSSECPNTIPAEKPTAEHSPLPWQVGDRSRYHTYVLSNGLEVCELLKPDRDERISDAKLIVASVNQAAQLAEVLNLIAQRANFMLVRNPQDHQADYIMQQANNALRAYEEGK